MVSIAAGVIHHKPRVLLPIGDGSDDVHTAAITSALGELGAEVVMATVTSKNIVVMKSGLKMIAHASMAAIASQPSDWDLIVITGGRNYINPEFQCSELTTLLTEQNYEKKLIGAVGSEALALLDQLGLCPAKAMSSSSSLQKRVEANTGEPFDVVASENIVTSAKGATSASALAFAFHLGERLFGVSEADAVARKMNVDRTGPVGVLVDGRFHLSEAASATLDETNAGVKRATATASQDTVEVNTAVLENESKVTAHHDTMLDIVNDTRVESELLPQHHSCMADANPETELPPLENSAMANTAMTEEHSESRDGVSLYYDDMFVTTLDESPLLDKESTMSTQSKGSESSKKTSTSTSDSSSDHWFRIVEVLRELGWDCIPGKRQTDMIYVPPGVNRRDKHVTKRVHYFDSKKGVLQFIEKTDEWRNNVMLQEALKQGARRGKSPNRVKMAANSKRRNDNNTASLPKRLKLNDSSTPHKTKETNEATPNTPEAKKDSTPSMEEKGPKEQPPMKPSAEKVSPDKPAAKNDLTPSKTQGSKELSTDMPPDKYSKPSKGSPGFFHYTEGDLGTGTGDTVMTTGSIAVSHQAEEDPSKKFTSLWPILLKFGFDKVTLGTVTFYTLPSVDLSNGIENYQKGKDYFVDEKEVVNYVKKDDLWSSRVSAATSSTKGKSEIVRRPKKIASKLTSASWQRKEIARKTTIAGKVRPIKKIASKTTSLSKQQKASKTTSPKKDEQIGTPPPATAKAKSQAAPTPSSAGKKKVNGPLFQLCIWNVLEQQLGWRKEVGNRPNDAYFCPPGVQRGVNGARNRRDFFDSYAQIVPVLEQNPPWKTNPIVIDSLAIYREAFNLKLTEGSKKENKKLKPQDWVTRAKEKLKIKQIVRKDSDAQETSEHLDV